MISTITATQVYKAISPIVRQHITDVLVYRLRNLAGLEASADEVSAVYDKNTIIKLYRKATEEPCSFLYMNLTARDANEMFVLRLERPLSPNEL